MATDSRWLNVYAGAQGEEATKEGGGESKVGLGRKEWGGMTSQERRVDNWRLGERKRGKTGEGKRLKKEVDRR